MSEIPATWILKVNIIIKTFLKNEYKYFNLR